MIETYNVGAMLQAQAQRRPEQPAVVFPNGRDASGPRWTQLSFAELDRRSDRYAHGFAEQGVKRGDRTLFLMKPSPEFYAVLFGLIKLGAVPVLLDPGMGIKNVLACIHQIEPRVLVAIPAVHAIRMFARRTFASVALPITAGRRWFWGGQSLTQCLGKDAPFEMETYAADDEFAIVFTSGSTGTPKGVSYTHGLFHAVQRLAGAELGRVEGKTVLETFTAFVVIDIVQGMTSVIPQMNLSKPATVDPARIVEALEAWKPSCAFASPVVLRRLTRYAAARGITFNELEHVLTGVAPIPGDLHTDLGGIAPNTTLHVDYGATEGMTATHIETPEILGETWALTGRGHGNCVGRPFPEMTIRIVRITEDPIAVWSDEWLVPDKEIGEIVLEGPVVSPEYKNRPDANAATKIQHGDAILHRSGDLGYVDDQGRLWFCGRMAHRLETGDGMVPCVPPEGVFNEHDAVARTALVGVGAPGSEIPVLVVEVAEGATWDEGVEKELLLMAKGTRWEGLVKRVLVHRGFPVDARHNSKIRRGDLKVWATAKLPELVAGSSAPRQLPG